MGVLEIYFRHSNITAYIKYWLVNTDANIAGACIRSRYVFVLSFKTINLLFLLYSGRYFFLKSTVEICTFDKQFLSDSYLLIFSPYWMKNMPFNSQNPTWSLWLWKKNVHIHRVINAQCQWHAIFGLRFFWDTLLYKQKVLWLIKLHHYLLIPDICSHIFI